MNKLSVTAEEIITLIKEEVDRTTKDMDVARDRLSKFNLSEPMANCEYIELRMLLNTLHVNHNRILGLLTTIDLIYAKDEDKRYGKRS